MKRDMDLIRNILIEVEACDEPFGPEDKLVIDGYDKQIVSYHVKLLCQARLLEGRELKEIGRFHWLAEALTWEGHEFARDETRWNKAKSLVVEKAGSLMFETLKFTLIQGIKTQLIS